MEFLLYHRIENKMYIFPFDSDIFMRLNYDLYHCGHIANVQPISNLCPSTADAMRKLIIEQFEVKDIVSVPGGFNIKLWTKQLEKEGGSAIVLVKREGFEPYCLTAPPGTASGENADFCNTQTNEVHG